MDQTEVKCLAQGQNDDRAVCDLTNTSSWVTAAWN